MEFLFFVIPVVVIGLIVVMGARKQKAINSMENSKDSENTTLLRKIERNTFIVMIIMVIMGVSSVISAIYTVLMLINSNLI